MAIIRSCNARILIINVFRWVVPSFVWWRCVAFYTRVLDVFWVRYEVPFRSAASRFDLSVSVLYYASSLHTAIKSIIMESVNQI